MKPRTSILLAALCLALAPAVRAEEGHDHTDKESAHDHHHAKKPAAPNGGRIVTNADLHFEFLVMPDKKLKITFLDEDNKPVAAKDQVVTAIGGDRSKPTRFTFAKDGNALVSDVSLPEGKSVPLVLMVKASPDAKTVTEKFNVNLSDCPTCEFQEYACVCEHGDGGHDH